MDKVKIVSARKYIDEYREKHEKMYIENNVNHSLLLDNLKENLKNLGFNSLKDFEIENRLLNIIEMGFNNIDEYKQALLSNNNLSHQLADKWN